MSEEAKLDAEAGFPIALYETVTDLNQYLKDHGAGVDYAGLVAKVASPDVKGILQSLIGPGAITEDAYRKALPLHSALRETYRRHFREYGVAAIIFPTTPAPAVKIGEDETFVLNGQAVPTFPTFIRNTSPGSVGGIPGISLPAGMTKAGLPVGIELVCAARAATMKCSPSPPRSRLCCPNCPRRRSAPRPLGSNFRNTRETST